MELKSKLILYHLIIILKLIQVMLVNMFILLSQYYYYTILTTGNQDTLVIQEFIKEIASHSNLESTTDGKKKGFKGYYYYYYINCYYNILYISITSYSTNWSGEIDSKCSISFKKDDGEVIYI